MALIPVEHASCSSEKPRTLPPPPSVVTTPCDPWPRPYFFEDGLRRIEPYHFTYNTYCKERWRGREILEIFASEFRDRPEEYYRDAILSGNVVLGGKRIHSIHTLVKNGEVISHTLHRHEPPVNAEAIGIVHENDDLIVINKPAGIPVHPSGRYNYNSIVEIMRAERGMGWNPLPCNRLDRLTSGIMFIGKHKKAAEDMSEQIKGRTVRKEYIAKVIGEFPEGDVVCEQPILQISPKLGLNRVRASGKEARTVFRRLAFYPFRKQEEQGAGTLASAKSTTNGTTDSSPVTKLTSPESSGYSIVRCLPLTGRTHQIRVHLQYLGHPITNDPIYASPRVFGPKLGALSSSPTEDASIISRLALMGKTEVADTLEYSELAARVNEYDARVEDYEKRKAEKLTGETCGVCGTELYSDPGPHELGIYLHALRYSCAEGKWEYSTPLPPWALPPHGMEGPREVNRDSDPMEADAAKRWQEAEDDVVRRWQEKEKEKEQEIEKGWKRNRDRKRNPGRRKMEELEALRNGNETEMAEEVQHADREIASAQV